MKKLVVICLFVASLVSCNVEERITFDANMGGTYESSFDMSPMMQIAGQGRPSSVDSPSKKLDTLMVFNDILVKYKDSIATLSAEEQQKLQKMKGMEMRMKMDEEAGIMNMAISKKFDVFEDIAFVSSEMDGAFNFAKNQSGATQAAGPADDMLKLDKVRYTFTNNTFKRVDEKVMQSLEKEEELETVEEETEDTMMAGMLAQFDEMLAQSNMRLVYTFPKKIKSVSHKEAMISEDGKTVTYELDWKTLLEDKSILTSFEVELED